VDGAGLGNDRVVGRVMPVSYARAPELTEAWARELGAELLLGVGVARGRGTPELERLGRRAVDPALADVDGAQLADLGQLAGEGPALRWSTLPETPFCAASGAIPSRDAGSYVCNAWLWQTLGRLPRASGVSVGFLHVPDAGMAPEALLAGLRAVREASAGAPVPAPPALRGSPVPRAVRRVLEAVARAGGRACVVGGSVRDRLLGAPGKDVDVEAHGLPLEALLEALRPLGRVDEVGRSFGVLKLRLEGLEVDVSLPRRDSRAGTGHKGIRADADPHLGMVEAARRRDLTLNAIAWDPLTDEVFDPFGGLGDLSAGLLRAVDVRTFGEDPLRALRVAQFAGRLGAQVDPELLALCAEAPLHELPAERIRGEVEKLLLRAPRPGIGWALAYEAGLWRKVLPSWDHPAPPSLDALAAAEVPEAPRRLALMLAGASASEAALEDVLERLKIFRVGGVRVRELARFLVRHREGARREVTDTDLRRWAEEGAIPLLALLAERPELLPRAEALGVAEGPLPTLVSGEDARALGIDPGPQLGAALGAVRAAQWEGRVTTREEALTVLRAVAGSRAGGA
jgi:tRNA nucleotidyltransferase (CCA-adding enzyme)